MSRSRIEDQDLSVDADDDVHPALKNHSRIASQAKHVLGGGFKGGLIGAGVGAAAFAGVATLVGGMTVVALGPVGWIASAVGLASGAGGLVTSAIGSAALAGAGYGGAIGATGGGLLALSSASDAADTEEDKIVNKFHMAKQRSGMLASLHQARDRQKAAMMRMDEGMNPNRGLPQGRGMGPEGPAYT